MDLPFSSSDAKTSRNQDAAEQRRDRGTRERAAGVANATEEELPTHPELQSFCHASWYFTGSSCRVHGSRHAESMY